MISYQLERVHLNDNSSRSEKNGEKKAICDSVRGHFRLSEKEKGGGEGVEGGVGSEGDCERERLRVDIIS